jgi:hypothetical protein
MVLERTQALEQTLLVCPFLTVQPCTHDLTSLSLCPHLRVKVVKERSLPKAVLC